MKLHQVNPHDLNPYLNNPRHNGKMVEALVKAIKEFGFRIPILATKGGEVIDGHARLEAAKRLALPTVLVLYADDLTEDQVRAFRISVNKISELSEWDEGKLAQELAALEENGFDLSLLAISADEISRLLLAMESADDTNDEPDAEDLDDAPELPTVPTTQPGDVYDIGPHRLVCGDSTSYESFEKLLPDGERAALVFTDPPYNVNYEGKAGKIQNDAMSEEQFRLFLLTVYRLLYHHSLPGCAMYVCYADSEAIPFRSMMLKARWQIKQTIIWAKNTHVLGRSDYQQQHEPILYGWKGGASHTWNGGRGEKTLWHFDKPNRSTLHPTMKPVALVEKALDNSSNPGDLVLDPFGGSGTTMVAAHGTGRIARLIELDPKFCDVIVQRMRDLWPSLEIRRNGQPI